MQKQRRKHIEGEPLSEISVRHDPGRERFEILDAGTVIGKAVYKPYDGGGSPQRIFFHTVVKEDYRGQGLAGRLAAAALDETVRDGFTIVPVCHFIKKFVAKHPEYVGSTTRTTRAHLEFVEASRAARDRAAQAR